MVALFPKEWTCAVHSWGCSDIGGRCSGQRRQFTAKSFIYRMLQRRKGLYTAHFTRNTAHEAPLTSAKEVAVNSSGKPESRPHCHKGGAAAPHSEGLLLPGSTQSPAMPWGQRGTPGLFCACPAYATNAPQPATMGPQRLRQPGPGPSGLLKATVLGSSRCFRPLEGVRPASRPTLRRWRVNCEFRIPLLRCQTALPPSPSRRRSCGRCSGRCPRC